MSNKSVIKKDKPINIDDEIDKWKEDFDLNLYDSTRGRVADMIAVVKALIRALMDSSILGELSVKEALRVAEAVGIKLCLEGIRLDSERRFAMKVGKIEEVPLSKLVQSICGGKSISKIQEPDKITVLRWARAFSDGAVNVWNRLKDEEKPLVNLTVTATHVPAFPSVVYSKWFGIQPMGVKTAIIGCLMVLDNAVYASKNGKFSATGSSVTSRALKTMGIQIAIDPKKCYENLGPTLKEISRALDAKGNFLAVPGPFPESIISITGDTSVVYVEHKAEEAVASSSM